MACGIGAKTLTGAPGEALAAVLLAVILVAAVTRPRWLPEAAVAVTAAIIVIATGVLPLTAARAETGRLLPVVGFLAAVLVLGQLCQSEGLFTAAGARLARWSRRDPVRLLTGTFVLASGTTAVLSLDTTVVLLTPVVHDTTTRLRLRPKPATYACTHLANSGSLLLPVSNLTNLLALAVCGLSLAGFTAVMALPWLAAIAVEYAVFRLFFRTDLAVTAGAPDREPEAEGEQAPSVPRFPLAVVLATLAGFAVTSFAGVSPAWAAAAGAGLLAARSLARRQITVTGIVRAAAIPFLLFVLSLGLVVQALSTRGLGMAVGRLLPHGSSLLALLAVAFLAAAIANLVNNLPAILVLLAAISASATGHATGSGAVTALVLAALIGVNIGPNLSYAGSLATLLWRRLLADRDQDVDLREFTRLGLATVPAGLAVATVALWVGLRLTGHG
ncbi:MAG TPA: SLC13 family permease [Streptosporangiaceae bacterium]